MTYLVLAVAIVLMTTGQLLQKLGAIKIKHNLTPFQFVFHIFTIKEFLWAVVCLSMGIVCWLFVLLHMEVSKAYPFLSIGYVLILFISKFYLNEEVKASRWIGVILITIGTALVAVS